MKIDKNNYNALVFVGVAAEGLDQMEQAHMAYKKAVEINEDNVLGWQVILNSVCVCVCDTCIIQPTLRGGIMYVRGHI